MNNSDNSQEGPYISQYDPGPEKQVLDNVARKLPEYEIYNFTGHLRVNKNVHDLGHVHEYEKVHESEYRPYSKLRGYEFKDYKPNFITRDQYEVVKEERAYEREMLMKKKAKLKSDNTNSIEKTKRIPYLIGPEAPLHEHEYKEYQLKVHDFQQFDLSHHNDYLRTKFESYMDRKIDNFKSPHEYKLTDDNFCPFKYRDVFEKPVEEEISEEEQAFLENLKFLKKYKRSKFIPVVHPKWRKEDFSKQSPPPQYSSLSIALPKQKKKGNTVSFQNLPDNKTVK